jgi:hypothetical protein
VVTAGGTLPGWAAEEIQRVTSKASARAAVEHLAGAVEAFVGAKYGRAVRSAEEAKQLAPRSGTVREVLALSLYRLGRWEPALRELRTYRRFTGDTYHMALEIDALRALDRPEDVERAWELVGKLGGAREAVQECRVVYASFLLDRDEPRAAWDVINPERIVAEARESDLRVWFVAAKVAGRLGDFGTARRLYEAVQAADPAFPGLDELDRATRE